MNASATAPFGFPAARYHCRELAHAEALVDDLKLTRREVEWHLERAQCFGQVAAEYLTVRHLLCAPCRGTGRTYAWHHPGGTCARCRGDGLSDFARRSALTVGDLNMTWADAHNRLGDGPDGLGR